jgi:general secretion pathway protein D
VETAAGGPAPVAVIPRQPAAAANGAQAGAPGNVAQPGAAGTGAQPAPMLSSGSPTSTPATMPVAPVAAAAGGAAAGAAAAADQTAGAAAAAAPSGPSALTWEGPAITTVGSTFPMTLTMQAGEPVTSVPLAIGYDAKLLEVVDVSEGDLLRQGSATNFSSRVDNSTGQIFATIVRSAADGAVGTGSLVTVTFKALGPAPDVRTQVLAISPIGQGGKTVGVSMPAPQSIAISP